MFRQKMKSWTLLSGMLLLLGGCIQLYTSEVIPSINHMRVPPMLPLPQTLHIERDDGQNWLLVIQEERDKQNDIRFRFSLFDPLGVPLARLLLVNGRRWKSDGLLPPNREAEDLFTTFLWAIHGSPEPYGQWHWSPHAPKASIDEYGLPVGSPSFQTWPVIRLCKHDGQCYQFTPVQTP